MIRCLQGLLSMVVVGVVVAGASSAQAQNVYAPFYGFNSGTGPYNLYDNERVVPHFALYPPVYYSVPVARSYGWSPFAYPPGVMTPEVEAPKAPVSMRNPHAVPSNSAPAADRSAQAPLTIENPYVVARSVAPALADAGPAPASDE
jgi:hypothetical protein